MRIASEKQNYKCITEDNEDIRSLVILVYVSLCHCVCSVLRGWCIHWNSWYSSTGVLAEMSRERFAQRRVCMLGCCWLNGTDM